MKNKPNIKKAVNTAKKGLSRRSPQILTGLGVIGFTTTVIMAIKATPKAMQLIEEAEQQKYLDLELDKVDDSYGTIGVKLTPLETFKVVWKPYLPVVALGTASAGCILGANSIVLKRTSALAAAAQLSREALNEYRAKTLEVIGEKKERVIRDKVAESNLKKHESKNQPIIITGKGGTKCFDPFSGREFESDIDIINKAVNEVNYCLLNEMYVSLNYFYEKIGLEPNGLGDLMGWNIDRDGQIEVDFSAQLTQNNEPCLVMELKPMPDYDFSKFVV